MSATPTPYALNKQLIADTFGAALAVHGFSLVRPMAWSRPVNDSIRNVVSLTKMKGNCYSPRWGYWLGYVPVVKRDRLASKGKNDGATIDLIFDPIDFDATLGISSWMISVEPNDGSNVRIEAHAVSSRTVAECTRFFSTVKSLTDLPGEFERTRTRPTRRFGWDNYVIQPLAYALTLAKLGEGESARAMLESWVVRFGSPMKPAAIAKVRASVETMLSARASV